VAVELLWGQKYCCARKVLLMMQKLASWNEGRGMTKLSLIVASAFYFLLSFQQVSARTNFDNRTDKELCGTATTGNPVRWEEIDWRFGPYVREAMRRGLSVLKCARILAGKELSQSHMTGRRYPEYHLQQFSNRTNIEICATATTGSPPRWEHGSRTSLFVEEAQGRGLSLNQCASILSNPSHVVADRRTIDYADAAKRAAENATRLEQEARQAKARNKAEAQARARQARMEAERLRKMKAEAEQAEALAKTKSAEAAADQQEAEARRKRAAAEAADADTQRQAALRQQQADQAAADKRRRSIETEAERKRVAAEAAAKSQRLNTLTIGLKPVNIFMDVATKSATLRDMPERSSDALAKSERGDQVHVVAMLPSGWVQIAEEGEPVGWMHRAALRASATAPAGNAPLTVAGAPAPSASPLYAVNYPFPEAPKNTNAIAILVSNQSYRHGDVPEVSYAGNDAEAMRQYLVKTLGYMDRNVITLRNATKATLEAWFGSRDNNQGRLYDMVRKGQSDVFVFYSGHGVPGEDRNGYLLPVDGDPGKAQLTGYGIETLAMNVSNSGARSTYLALDTCFSGLSQAGSLVPAASGIYLSPKLPGVTANSVVLTAADGKQIASWDRGAQLGLFTRHLLEGLLGKADEKSGDSDGNVTVAEIKSYLQSEVAYQARRLYGRDQTPQVMGAPSRVLASLTAPDFPGFGKASAVSSGARPLRVEPAVVQKPVEEKSTDPISSLLKTIFKGNGGSQNGGREHDR
jgi:hypothetical protein